MATPECLWEADDLGPAKVIQCYEPRSGLRSIVVLDNMARGPAIGGLRIAADVSVREVARLARAMTLKNALAGLPYGGGKSGILLDPKAANKEQAVRLFARSIAQHTDYVPGPDMGTDESCMAWIYDEIGRAIGLPRALGGVPFDEIGATGYGLAACAGAAAPFCGLTLKKAKVAIEGFGSVGRHAAKFLCQLGASLVAASDRGGTIHNPQGIDVDELAAAKAASGSVTAYPQGQKLPQAALFGLPCDLLIPAARPDSIHAGNAGSIQARLVLEGANIATTPEADAILYERGVLVVPDIVANAGGTICGAMQLQAALEEQLLARLAQQIRRNTEEVLARSQRDRKMPRRVAISLARERVQAAQIFRR